MDLGKDIIGIEALQVRLKDILTEIVRREFPGVSHQIIEVAFFWAFLTMPQGQI